LRAWVAEGETNAMMNPTAVLPAASVATLRSSSGNSIEQHRIIVFFLSDSTLCFEKYSTFHLVT